jgi:hypothetical protein
MTTATQPTLYQQDPRPRRMPPMRAIEEHHGIEHGLCFRCREYRRCERAHVVDHCYHGPDTVDNLVPLCYPCHDAMPCFTLEEERYAWAWLRCDADTYFRWRWNEISADHKARLDDIKELPPRFFEQFYLFCWPGANGREADLTEARRKHLEDVRPDDEAA